MVEPEPVIAEGPKPYQIIRIVLTREQINNCLDSPDPGSLTALLNQRGRIDHLAEHVESIVENRYEDFDKMAYIFRQEVYLKDS